MITTLEIPVVETVSDLKSIELIANRDNVVMAKLGHALGWFDPTLPIEDQCLQYEFNRGTGIISQKTMKRVRDNYHPNSFGTVILAKRNSVIVTADGHSRIAGLLELKARGDMTRYQLDRLISLQVTDDLLGNYIDKNAQDSHKNAAKVQHPNLLVGALARKIECIIKPLILPVVTNTREYSKLENILIAHNTKLFRRGEITNNIAALNTGNAIWKGRLLDVKDGVEVDVPLHIDSAYVMAVQRYVGIRQALTAIDSGYTKKVAESIGLMAVLVIEFLTKGPISEVTDTKLVKNCNFGEVVGVDPGLGDLWKELCHCIENVSSTRKAGEMTANQWDNIIKIMTRRCQNKKPGKLNRSERKL